VKWLQLRRIIFSLPLTLSINIRSIEATFTRARTNGKVRDQPEEGCSATVGMNVMQQSAIAMRRL
jgi:hypothetical protein